MKVIKRHTKTVLLRSVRAVKIQSCSRAAVGKTLNLGI